VWRETALGWGRDLFVPGADADAEVDLGVPHQRHETVKRAVRIGFAVDADDVLAAPAQQLVDRHVLDVPAVGQVEPRLLLRHPEARHLAHETGKAGSLEPRI